MAFKLPSLKRKEVPAKIQGMLTFNHDDVSNKEVIGHGSFGLVYRASHGRETIVIKQCVGESSEAQHNFLKEAKLLCSLEHENIVTFKGFCYDPCSIMLEYLYFDFSPFKIEKKVSTLVDLVNYVDKVDGESEILDTKTVYKICKDVAESLSYLHKKDIAHRDLKAANVLVSNKHYCNISDTFVQAREFSKCPIVCKLADFGEGRSREIQTAALHSATRRVDRGTPVYMAPEIILENSNRLASASFTDLQRIDVWAYGMVLFNVLNPDQRYPFQLDLKKGKNPVNQVQDLLSKHKRPTSSPKYQANQDTKWSKVLEVFHLCTAHDPSKRPLADDIVSLLRNEHNGNRDNEAPELSILRDVEDGNIICKTTEASLVLDDSENSDEEEIIAPIAKSDVIRSDIFDGTKENPFLLSDSDVDSENEEEIIEPLAKSNKSMAISSSNSDEQVGTDEEFYNGNPKLPVYSKEKKILSPAQTVRLLQAKDTFSHAKVCQRQPLQIEHHRSFLINLKALKSVGDVKCDDMGAWRNNSSSKFKFKTDGESITTVPAETSAKAEDLVILKREYFILKHDVHKDVRKRIDTIIDQNKPGQYCLIQYSFKGGIEHPVEPAPHGNSKKKHNSQYVRTWESTKDALRKESLSKKPREAVHDTIDNALGGITACRGIGQLPRNRQQVKDFARKKTPSSSEGGTKNLSGNGNVNDPWYCLLTESKVQARDKNTAFIRDVRIGPEPLCVLASKRQLNDLKRFCCNPSEYKPLTVDPTFDIGAYNVTPISYQHLLLNNRGEDQHPTLIGPVLIHERKTTESYSTFCGSIKTLAPELNNLLSYGTDDEEALVNAFEANFLQSTHVLCSIHLRKNVEAKLIDLGIKGQPKQDILADIFGRKSGNVHESGLVDADSAEVFLAQMNSLEQNWSENHNEGKRFFEWFLKNKSEKFIKSVISPVRQRAGLGCPPSNFTTNRSERTNGIIQDYIRRKSGRLPVDVFTFATTLQSLVEIQEKEMELAVVGRGEYELRPLYNHLQVSANDWVKKTEVQQRASLSKVHESSLEDVSPTSVTTVSRAINTEGNSLYKKIVDFGVDWIPRDIMIMTAVKASKIVDEEGAILMKGSGTFKTVIIPSKSDPKKPHTVVIYANGKSECQNCHAYKSSSICAHIIAACIKTSWLDKFLKWLVSTRRKTGGIIYSEAIEFGMPKGRGRKGEKPPRKRSKKSVGQDFIVVPRISTAKPSHETPGQQLAPPKQPTMQHQRGLGYSRSAGIATPTQQPYIFSQHSVQQHIPPSGFHNSGSATNAPNYPAPLPYTYQLYILYFCPPLTSVCFGCGNPLKPDGTIPSPPGDLVIVSNMAREWMLHGQPMRKMGNVYFHPFEQCVRGKYQAFTAANQLEIPPIIYSSLTSVHRQFIWQNLGIHI